MRVHPTALAWIDDEVSTAPEWDRARVQRLARHLGYAITWPGDSLIPLTDQVRAADVDAVIVPSTSHLDPMTLNSLMGFVDVEAVTPRMSFARWPAFTPEQGRQ